MLIWWACNYECYRSCESGILDSYNLDFQARTVRVIDDIAYVAFSNWGTVMFNVSDPSDIVYLNRFLMGWSHYDADLGEDYALFNAALNDGLDICNVSNPTTPNHTTTPTNTSGFKNGLIFGFSLMTLVAVIVLITDRRRIRYTG